MCWDLARALESNKWVARGTSDGISTIVDNNGTIVTILEKGISGSIKGDIYKTSKKLMPLVHLPVQSGSDKVLAAMKRGYTVLEYKSVIRKLKKARRMG